MTNFETQETSIFIFLCKSMFKETAAKHYKKIILNSYFHSIQPQIHETQAYSATILTQIMEV